VAERQEPLEDQNWNELDPRESKGNRRKGTKKVGRSITKTKLDEEGREAGWPVNKYPAPLERYKCSTKVQPRPLRLKGAGGVADLHRLNVLF
jgi:hypothetical protein